RCGRGRSDTRSASGPALRDDRGRRSRGTEPRTCSGALRAARSARGPRGASAPSSRKATLASSDLSIRGRVPQGCWGLGQASDWNPPGGAARVVHADLVAEGDGRRVPSLLATDTDFERRALLAAALDADPHQLADALGVDRLEGVVRQHFLFEVFAQ